MPLLPLLALSLITQVDPQTPAQARPDIVVKADAEQVAEKDSRAYLYYLKSKTEENTYFAGRFHSKGHFALTYGYLEARLHLVKPEGYQTALKFGVNDWVTGHVLQNTLVQQGGTAQAYIDYVRVFKRTEPK